MAPPSAVADFINVESNAIDISSKDIMFWDGTWGCQKLIFFEHGHVAYQLKGMMGRTGQKRNFYPRVKLVTLGWDKYH